MLHIDIPTLAEFKALAATKSDACVSLYVPTSPLSEHARADRIAFEDLAKEALSQLKTAGLDKRRIAPIVVQFGHLSGVIQENTDDIKFEYRQSDPSDEIDEFWTTRSNGLAVLATPEMMRTFRLPNRPKPLTEVADRFHLTPLIRATTSPHDVFVHDQTHPRALETIPQGENAPLNQVLLQMPGDLGLGQGTELRLDVLNIGDAVYEIRNGTGVGVGAPQFGIRRAILQD
jgi:hypothetical protein